MHTGLRYKSSQTHASASAPHLSVYLGRRMTSVRGAFLFARPSFGGRSLLSELSEDGGFRAFLRTGVGELVDSSRLRLANWSSSSSFWVLRQPFFPSCSSPCEPSFSPSPLSRQEPDSSPSQAPRLLVASHLLLHAGFCMPMPCGMLLPSCDLQS